jgi:chorismate mutase/prephenate dehydratase
MDLCELRRRIDEIDSGIINLYLQRMYIAEEIAKYKQARGMPVYDPAREQQKQEGLPDDQAELFALLFGLSRKAQAKIMTRGKDA